MRKATIIQLSVALLLSLAAGLLIFKFMNANSQKQASGPVSVQVAAATKNFARGHRLTAKDIELIPALEDSLPDGTFRDVKALEGRVLASSVNRRELITASRLQDGATSGTGITSLIAPGKRAIAVKGNKVLGMSGLITPGNRVDVLVAIDVPKKGKDVSMAKVVIENAKVLAAGTEITPVNEEGETSEVDVFTLELSSRESERIALAASRGTLFFALRGAEDAGNVSTPGIDVPKLLASLKDKKPQKRRKVRRRFRRVNVEVITGTNREVMRFRREVTN